MQLEGICRIPCRMMCACMVMIQFLLYKHIMHYVRSAA